MIMEKNNFEGGWALPSTHTLAKLHYFNAQGRTLCREYGGFDMTIESSRNTEEEQNPLEKHCCKICWRMKNKKEKY